MSSTPPSHNQADENQWIPETRFGKWFLSTNIWFQYVLEETIANLKNLLGNRTVENARILDVGCGQGQSFALLEKYFKPGSILAVDVDREILKTAEEAGQACQCDVDVEYASARRLNLPDNSMDVVFCHQLIHHITFREEALLEFYRVLKPGGLLLLSESCKPFLNVYWVRWFFRHPEMEQKTAEGYIDLVRKAGFSFSQDDILETTPWWSRRDFGLLEKLGLQWQLLKTTEISIVSTKPK